MGNGAKETSTSKCLCLFCRDESPDASGEPLTSNKKCQDESPDASGETSISNKKCQDESPDASGEPSISNKKCRDERIRTSDLAPPRRAL